MHALRYIVLPDYPPAKKPKKFAPSLTGYINLQSSH